MQGQSDVRVSRHQRRIGKRLRQWVIPEQAMRPPADDDDAVKVRTDRIHELRELLVIAFGGHRRALSTLNLAAIYIVGATEAVTSKQTAERA